MASTTVTSSAELQAALAVAKPGDTIKFGNSKTYTLSGDTPLFTAGTGTLTFDTAGYYPTITGGRLTDPAGGKASILLVDTSTTIPDNATSLLRLSGADTYTGSTTVTATGSTGATLVGGVADAFGVNSAVSLLAMGQAARLDLGGYDQHIGSLADASGSTAPLESVSNSAATGSPGIAAGAVTTLTTGGNDASTTFSGVIGDGTGKVAFVKTGTGTQTLAGTNSYTGGTTISAGALAVSADANLGGPGSVTFNGGTLETTGSFTSARTVVLSQDGKFQVDANRYLALSGPVMNGSGNSGNLVKTGAGALVLSGANTYTGRTTISAGTLQIGSGTTTGTINSGSIVDNGALAVYKSSDLSLGAISGSGSLTVYGAGSTNSTYLTGASTYTNATTIGASGKLYVGQGGSLTGTSGITDNGTFGTATTADVTVSASITGTGAVSKQASGTTTLGGTNTYSGGTVISQGTLKAGSSAAFGSGAVSSAGSLTGDAALDLAGYRETVGGLSGGTSNNYTLTVTNSATAQAALTLNVGTATALAFSGIVADGSGAVALVKAGAGTQVLSGANSYSGSTTVSAGRLVVDGSTAAGSAVTVASGAALGGAGTVAGSVTVSGTLSAGGTATGASVGTLTTGALTFSANATYREDFTGTTAADRVNAAGVALGTGARLDLGATGAFTTAAGQSVTLIDNTGAAATTGAFSTFSLNGGTGTAIANNTFTAYGRSYKIDYAANVDNGAQGNDVTLTDVTVGTPTANGQSDAVAFNTATAITLTGSDPDTPPLPLTYTVTGAPAHGTLSGTAPNLTYTPTAGYAGTDSFTFTDSNGTNTSGAATVSLSVAPPAPAAPTLAATSDSGVAGDGVTNVKAATFTGTALPGAAVAIKDGAVVIGTGAASSTDGTYSIPTSGLTEGANTITAVQTAGGVSSAAGGSLKVMLDTVAPTVALGATSGGRVEATSGAGAAVSFAAAGTDAVDGTDPVSFTETVGGTTRTVQSGDTFALGTHTVTATATDKAGNPGTAAYTFTVRDTVAPTVALGATSGGRVEATSGAGAAVSFAAAGTDAVDGADPVSFTETVGGTARTVQSGDTFALGTHTVTATATDKAGNAGTAAYTFTVRDTVAPAVALGATSGGTVEATSGAGAAVSFAAAGTDAVDGADPVSFTETVGGTARTVQSGDTFALGTHTVTATATDKAGNPGTAAYTFTVRDTVAPAVAIVSPGGSTASNRQMISGTVTDVQPSTVVSVYDNGAEQPFATAAVQKDGTWSIPVDLVVGENRITAKNTDLAGNIGTSAAVLYTYAPPQTPSAPVAGPFVANSVTPGPDSLTVPMGGSVAGLAGDDTIVGAGSNVLLGNQGNDLIIAGTGPNTVYGGMGNDTISAGDGNDLLFGGEGADSILAGNGDNTIVGGSGNSATDSLDGADYIISGSGNDLILGNGGDDTVGAGAGSDTVVGGYGNDVLLGNQGDDVLLGNQGDDTLFGGQGNDTLVGGQGNDVIYGNQGDDVLYGNEGLNTFVFNPGDTDFKSGLSTGDTIMDFATGTSRIDFASGPVGSVSNFGATSTTTKDFAGIQNLAQSLINGGDAYAFVADGTNGFLFTTGGTGTAITDAVKLMGAGSAASVKYGDIAHGALA